VELVRRIGARPGDVTRVDYRGGGWPGRFRARGETEVLAETEYRKAWDFLAGGMPALRCFVCGDGMAAEADLSVGDPWGLPEKERTREGRTYVIARTEIGGHAAAEGMLGRAIEFENAPEEWAAGRAAIQERRAETARRRLTTYRAVFRFAGVARALAENGLAALPTVIRQRLKTGYY
jgi:coenzyme F420-reducing hydrogenase beta subunit